MPIAAPYSGELREKLDEFRRLGQEEASSHRPPADAARPDQHENAIISEAQQRLASEKNVFQTELAAHSAAAVKLRQECAELPAGLERVLADDLLPNTIAAAQTEHKPTLVAAAVTRLRLETDLKSLREKNGIGDQASYPESHIWHFAIIALLALIETAINAFFYENSQGLLGGFAVALGVSVVNMSGALVLGIGFRFKNLAAPLRKGTGVLSLVAFAVLSVYCNALFSAFRAEYQLLSDPSDAMQLRHAFTLATAEAAKVLTLSMHFADLMSFILFGFGFLLSCFAFYKG